MTAITRNKRKSVFRLSAMRVSIIHHFALVWSFFIILGCTTVNDQNFGSNPRNKDVVVTFPAWVSEQKKITRFETEAELKSISKCDGGKIIRHKRCSCGSGSTI